MAVILDSFPVAQPMLDDGNVMSFVTWTENRIYLYICTSKELWIHWQTCQRWEIISLECIKMQFGLNFYQEFQPVHPTLVTLLRCRHYTKPVLAFDIYLLNHKLFCCSLLLKLTMSSRNISQIECMQY